MNALFIGPYRQKDDWGLISRSYIRSIATQISNLSIRPIYLTNQSSSELDQDLQKYESTQQSSYDIVFQHTLPNCFVPQTMTKKNIGIFQWSNNNISHSNSLYLLNRLTEVCVPSTQEAKSLKVSGLKTPVKTISQPLDIQYIKKYIHGTSHAFAFDPIIEKSFKFYTIGEYTQRNNILDIILAFNLAFSNTDSVSLIISSSRPGLSSQASYQHIAADITQMKTRMNIGIKPNREVLMTEALSEEAVMKLHQQCDCYISATLGDSFCRRSAEALCFGNTPIVTDHTGLTDYIKPSTGFIIKSHKTPVLANEKPLSNEFDIYNAHEHWYQPNIYSLIEHMQTVYTMFRKEKTKLEEKRQAGLSMLDSFSYDRIGHNICN